MELKEVKYLLKIFQNASITKAADELFISQPALSKFLKNQENRIGSQLFSRIGNDLIPTYIGARYYEYLTQIESIQNNWLIESNDLLGEEKGQLSIAIPLMRGSCILPSVLSKFYHIYPKIQVTLLEESHSVEKNLLSSNDIDFVIYNDISPHPSLVHEDLGKEEIVLIMAQNHPLAAQGVIKKECRYPWLDLSLIRNESFILHPIEQTTGKIVANLLNESGIEPNILLKTRNTDFSIRLASSSNAISFTPESYINIMHFEKPPICFSVGTPKTETNLYAIYKKGRYLPKYAKYFLNLIREYLLI